MLLVRRRPWTQSTHAEVWTPERAWDELRPHLPAGMARFVVYGRAIDAALSEQDWAEDWWRGEVATLEARVRAGAVQHDFDYWRNRPRHLQALYLEAQEEHLDAIAYYAMADYWRLRGVSHG